MRWLGDIIGLSVMAAMLGTLAVLVPRSSATLTAWLVAYAILAVISIPLWRNKSSPVRPQGWLQVMGIIVLLDLGSFIIDILVGELLRPQHSLIRAAMSLGGPLGFGLTSIVIPALFVAAAAGLVRSTFLYRSGYA